MTLVVLADDAFSFLFAWELMSLASWALVMAHHRERRQPPTPASSTWSWRAFSGLTLLLASACWPAPRAATASPRCAPRTCPPGIARAGVRAGTDRRRLESRPGAAACLAAARASRRAEPCLGADERRDDQGRGLRLHPHRLRPARPADLVVRRRSCSRSAASPPCWACCMR